MRSGVKGQGFDALRSDTSLPQNVRKGSFECPAPVLRVLLTPANLRITGWLLAASGGGNLSLAAQQRQLHAAAADIHSQNVICHIRHHPFYSAPNEPMELFIRGVEGIDEKAIQISAELFDPIVLRIVAAVEASVVTSHQPQEVGLIARD